MVFVASRSTEDPAIEANMSLKQVEHRKAGPLVSMHPASAAVADETESTSSSSSIDVKEDRQQAKAKLKELLKQHNRSAKHPEVLKAIEELQALNPSEDVAFDVNLEGDFCSLTKPEFPGRIQQDPENDHIDQYTLGRMSFNIFQPKDLVCTIQKSKNTMKRIPNTQGDSESENRTFAYPLVTEIVVHTPKGDFPAHIRMEAQCSSEKQPKNRLGVTFVGGTLMPAHTVKSDSAKLALWKEVFANAYRKAQEEQSYLSAAMGYVFKWLFKLSTPSDEEAMKNDYTAVHFEMKRCPHGYIDILYLDEDLRITRGNRGTVVIVERDD